MPLSPNYADNVFINCPFDGSYQKILHAIAFTIIRTGFIPHCALEHDDASENRVDKIYRIIKNCRYGIHDISNTTLDKLTGLPRLNMPFELGLFLSAKYFGNRDQQKKNVLIFEKDKFSSKIYLSDINGVDPKAHDGNYMTAIRHTRQWLATTSRRNLTGYVTIQNEFENFYNNVLPATVIKAGLETDSLTFNDYCFIVSEWIIKL